VSRSRTSNRGRLFVVSAPSGTGKTTVVREVLRRDRKLYKTVSHTSRPPRPGERSGRDYHFVPAARFERMIREGAFVEWTKVYGNYYGTSRRTLEEGLRKGRDLVLVIEGKGGRAIRRLYPGAVFVRIVPPSMAELRKRLTLRCPGDPADLARRLASARRELKRLSWYPYRIVNDRLPEAVAALRGLVRLERMRPCRA
jgi:guanylate kinase